MSVTGHPSDDVVATLRVDLRMVGEQSRKSARAAIERARTTRSESAALRIEVEETRYRLQSAPHLLRGEQNGQRP